MEKASASQILSSSAQLQPYRTPHSGLFQAASFASERTHSMLIEGERKLRALREAKLADTSSSTSSSSSSFSTSSISQPPTSSSDTSSGGSLGRPSAFAPPSASSSSPSCISKCLDRTNPANILTALSLISCSLTAAALLTPNFGPANGLYRNQLAITDNYTVCAKVLAGLYAALSSSVLYWFRGVAVAARLAGVGGGSRKESEDDGR